MAYKILIVEDEIGISELLKSYFSREGMEVFFSYDGLEAITKFTHVQPDVVVLDRMLPGITGDQVCKEIRSVSDVPILMLTAKSSEESKLEGFEMGVDDYVTKPFSAKELVFRVKALLKRTYHKTSVEVYEVGKLKIDRNQRRVFLSEKEVHLTANEFDILEVLFMSRPNPLTRAQIVEGSFGYNYEAYERNMDTYIKNIRHKLELNPKSPEYVCTKYGIGYYFNG